MRKDRLREVPPLYYRKVLSSCRFCRIYVVKLQVVMVKVSFFFLWELFYCKFSVKLSYLMKKVLVYGQATIQ